MRRPCHSLLCGLLALWAFAAPAGAEDSPQEIAMSARLMAVEGKFYDADNIIERGPPEVVNDAALRVEIADKAARWASTKVGEEKRAALDSARKHYGKIVELTTADPKAVTPEVLAKAAAGAVSAAQGLGDLDVAAKKTDDAKAQAKFGVTCGEAALAAGVATREFKEALGKMYGFRASFINSAREVEQLVSDSAKSSKLCTEAASGNESAYALLSYAAKVQLRCAHLIHEKIPRDDEKRDDEAMFRAMILATEACKQPGATETDYATHLSTLLVAHHWGMDLKGYKLFLQAVAPPIGSLKLQQPRASGWTHEKASGDFDAMLTRDLHDEKNGGAVQLMLKQWSAKQQDQTSKKSWSKLDDIAPARFEKLKSEVDEISSSVEPQQLAPKGAAEIWYYEVRGKKGTRIKDIAEWIWGDRKKDEYWQMKIIDWRPVPDLQEPDIVAFVGSAIGEGLWPKAPETKPPKKR